MANSFWQAVFPEFWIFLLLKKNLTFSEKNLSLLDLFRVNVLILITFWLILAAFEDLWKIKKSKLVDPRWPPLRTRRYCDVVRRDQLILQTSKETFWKYYLPSKFSCRSLNILRVKKWGRNLFSPSPRILKKPGLNRVKQNLMPKNLMWSQTLCSGKQTRILVTKLSDLLVPR